MKLIEAFKAFFKTLCGTEEKPKITTITANPTHLQLLALMQKSSRLVDFFKEDITAYTDAQVGAAVRKIHQDCSKLLEEYVTIRPIMDDNEGASIKVAPGYDANAIKLVGKVKGEPPYTGILVHKGWKAHKKSLPKMIDESSEVICPAEIEIR